MPSPFQLNKTYDLNTLAPAVLGASLKNLKFAGSVTYEIASQYINIPQLHAAIFPVLPIGTPGDYTSYEYHIFKENNKRIVLADLWIDHPSIVLRSNVVINVSINAASSADVISIRDMLILGGYRDITMTVQ